MARITLKMRTSPTATRAYVAPVSAPFTSCWASSSRLLRALDLRGERALRHRRAVLHRQDGQGYLRLVVVVEADLPHQAVVLDRGARAPHLLGVGGLRRLDGPRHHLHR